MKKNHAQLRLTFQKFGFSVKETDVYFALLELGRGTVAQISRKAGINRTTGYDILDSLVSKELINLSGKEPKQEYIAESPEKIHKYFDIQTAQLLESKRELESIIPELRSIQSVSNRAQVKFYEGLEGLETVYEDTLTSKEKILAYACIDDMHKTLPDYFPKYYKRRAEKGISIKGIIPRTAVATERVRHNVEEKREVAFVPAAEYYFSPEINVYDNKVMIASWKEKLGIIIESEEIADAMKKIFKLAWGEARRLDNDSL